MTAFQPPGMRYDAQGKQNKPLCLKLRGCRGLDCHSAVGVVCLSPAQSLCRTLTKGRKTVFHHSTLPYSKNRPFLPLQS